MIFNLIPNFLVCADVLSDIDVINSSYYACYGTRYTLYNFTLTNEQYTKFYEYTSGYTKYVIVAYDDVSNSSATAKYYATDDDITFSVDNSGRLIITFTGAMHLFTFMQNSSDVTARITTGNYTSSKNYTFGSSSSSNYYYVYCTDTNTYNPDDPVTTPSFLDRFWTGFRDMFFKDIGDTANFVFGDDGLNDWVNNLGDNYCDYVKTLLGLEDADGDTVNQYLTDIYNNDYSSDIWVNYDNDTINNIKMTTNNLRQFYYNNFTLNSYDSDTNTYNYSVKNYNSETNTYPSWYYDTYYFDNSIVYNSNTDLSSVILWLQTIDNDIIAFHIEVDNYLLDINNDINTLVGAFADFDFNAIVCGLADIDASVNALGGVFAGAIGGVFNDFILDLDSIFDDFLIDFGDNIGDSYDTSTTTIYMSQDYYNHLDNLLKNLINNLDVNLRDLFDDITLKVDVSNNSGSDELTEDDFWKQAKEILIQKIPLYYQCVNLLEPLTDVNSDNLINSNPSLLLPDSSDTSNTATESINYFNDSASSSIFGNMVKFYGDNHIEIYWTTASLPGADINNPVTYLILDTSRWTSSVWYDRFSLFLCAIFYVVFAWKVAHRTASLFNHNNVSDGGVS